MRRLLTVTFLAAARLAVPVRQGGRGQADLIRDAVIAERRRIAENLHDGLAQDLALIAAHGSVLSEQIGAQHPVAVAARRAFAVSRSAITELSSSPADEPLEAVAIELAQRFEIEIVVDARPMTELAPDVREHLTRIAREAIANAAIHGKAEHVMISLTLTAAGLTLRIEDDGCGIGARLRLHTRDGCGLGNMHRRAEAMGGHMTVSRRSTGGTELEVVVR